MKESDRRPRSSPDIRGSRSALTPGEAKKLIDDSRASDGLRGVSQDDLFAECNEREANNHEGLRRALADSHGVALSLEDFVLKGDEFDAGVATRSIPFSLRGSTQKASYWSSIAAT